MIILTETQIKGKIKRMAIEIYERHAEEKQIILAGLNTKGYRLAELMAKELKELCDMKSIVCPIKLNPADPLSSPITIGLNISDIKNNVVIITDDVCNSGRTLFFAFKPFMEILPKTLEVAVLVERMHKRFPINIDYIGLKLATTTKDDIDVNLEKGNIWEVKLQ